MRHIFIVEDHPVFRESLIQLINGEKDLEVCGFADSAEEALGEIERLSPTLALVNITLSEKKKVALIKKIRAANQKTKLLVVSTHDEPAFAEKVLVAGGDGYILKEEDPEEFVHAIRDILAGHIYISEVVISGRKNGAKKTSSREKRNPFKKLSDADLEVLKLLGCGRSNQEIARQLRLTVPSINCRCEQLQKKLKLRHSNALIRFAVCWVENVPR